MKYKILKEVFGYDDFRLDQAKVIDNILEKKNTLAIMPTGGGKSLCFQIPAIINDGLTIVVSPLISLMKDQVDQLNEIGIPSATINSTTDKDKDKIVFSKIFKNELKLLYMSPEKIVQQKVIDYFVDRNIEISQIAVDEAHCVSMWGHDFREEYRDLKKVFKKHKNIPIIALTATADERTIKDIQDVCNIDDDNVFVNSFDRPNISLNIINKKSDGYSQIKKIVKNRKNQCGIIYCSTKRESESVTKKLLKDGILAATYNADIDKEKRNLIQDKFIEGKIDIIVATTAFGMGINKPDVRFVIHNSIPYSIENYYQEIGRAGRDGKDSDAIMLFSYSDVNKINSMLYKDSEVNRKKFQQMIDFVTSTQCKRKTLLKNFNEDYKDDCNNCCHCNRTFTNERDENSRELSKDILITCNITKGEKGLMLISDILSGSPSVPRKYKKLEQYGKYRKQYTKDDLIHYIREVVAEKYIIQKTKRRGVKVITTSQLSKKGLNALKNQKYPLLKKPIYEFEKSVKTKTVSRRNSKKSHKIYDIDYNIYRELKQFTLKVAKKLEIPPYKVLNDETIKIISSVKPCNISDLYNIKGIGKHKAKKLGKYIIDIVNSESLDIER